MINSWLINWHDAKEEKPTENTQVVMLLQHITAVGQYKNGAFYTGNTVGVREQVEVSFWVKLKDDDVLYWDYVNIYGVNGLK